MNRLRSNIIAGFVIVFGLLGVFLTSRFVERSRPALPDGYADEDLSLQAKRMNGFALGFEGLLADWYWMRSLQYIGDKVVKDREKNTDFNLENLKSLNPRLLYPLLDNATTLDPKFSAAYSYGAVVLPAIDSGQAVKLIEKGIANNPEDWRLYSHLGYIYWRLGEYSKAADAYGSGAKVPGAAPFMKIMASKMLTAGGDRDTARAIYEEMLAGATDGQIRDNAALHLAALDSLAEREAINIALQKFKEKTNRCVNSWREVLPLLQALKLPNNKNFRVDASGSVVDPSGAPYVLDKENCEAKLDAEKTKILLR